MDQMTFLVSQNELRASLKHDIWIWPNFNLEVKDTYYTI